MAHPDSANEGEAKESRAIGTMPRIARPGMYRLVRIRRMIKP